MRKSKSEHQEELDEEQELQEDIRHQEQIAHELEVIRTIKERIYVRRVELVRSGQASEEDVDMAHIELREVNIRLLFSQNYLKCLRRRSRSLDQLYKSQIPVGDKT